MTHSRCYLGPSWKIAKNVNSKEGEFTHNQLKKEHLRQKMLCEFASLDDHFYMPFDDFDYMLTVLDEKYTPVVFYEETLAFPQDYQEYIDDTRLLEK